MPMMIPKIPIIAKVTAKTKLFIEDPKVFVYPSIVIPGSAKHNAKYTPSNIVIFIVFILVPNNHLRDVGSGDALGSSIVDNNPHPDQLQHLLDSNAYNFHIVYP